MSLMMSKQIMSISQTKEGIFMSSEYEGQPIYLTSLEKAEVAYENIYSDVAKIPFLSYLV